MKIKPFAVAYSSIFHWDTHYLLLVCGRKFKQFGVFVDGRGFFPQNFDWIHKTGHLTGAEAAAENGFEYAADLVEREEAKA